MEKTKSHAFGKDCYLLGSKDNTWYWLEESKFDCEWYWSIGYIETYTNNQHPSMSRDINSHSHFYSMFCNGNKNCFDNINSFFDEKVLTEKETWTFCEIMKSLYTIREYSDLLHTGGAHYTGNPSKDIIKNEAEYKRINEIVIPDLLKNLYSLLDS